MAVYENFIAYRRSESFEEAKIIYDRLRKIGFETMLDTEELTAGDYKEHLYEFASTCTNYIVLLKETSFDRYQENNSDLFVKGIEFALDNRKNVIPIFLTEEIIFPSNIPSQVEKIKDIESCVFHKDRADECINTLVKRFLVDKHKSSISDSSRDFYIDGDTLVEFVGTASIVDIPDCVKRIGPRAFKDKTKITKVKFHYGIEEIQDGAFERCINITNIILPDSVKKIGKKAFSRCYNLAFVDLGSGLKVLEEEAFSYCSKLKWFLVTRDVESISGSAFNGCSNLEAFRVDNDNKYFCSRDGILFDHQKLRVIRCPESNELDYIDLPNTTKVLGPWAFYRCLNVSQITLPRSVEEICEFAFGECGNMDSIVLSGNISKFAVTAVKGWDVNRIRFSKEFSPVEKKKIELELKKEAETKGVELKCEFVVIKTTFESIEEAKNMATMLVRGKYIVSGQIHQIESIYLWEKEINDEFEYELSCITSSEKAEKVKQFISANHSYENCQLLITPIIDATKEIANWIYESLEVVK